MARSVETALHKLHVLGFDLSRVVSGLGKAPLPPVASDDLVAIGLTNDAILYGGQVTLSVRGDDDSIAEIGPRVPSSSSPDHGRPFGEIFSRYNNDFYRIDPLLFSPQPRKPEPPRIRNMDRANPRRLGRDISPHTETLEDASARITQRSRTIVEARLDT